MPRLSRINRMDVRDTVNVLLRRRELDFDSDDLTASATTQTFDIGAALPAGAIILYGYVNVTTKFQDVGDTDTTTCSVGIKAADIDSIIDVADIKTVALTDATVGAKPAGFAGAVTLLLTVDSDVDVDTLTAGAATIVVLYVDPSDADLAS